MPPRSVADRGRARNQVGRAGSVAINIRLLSGGPPKADRKQTTTLRLDPDLLKHFRKSGPGWQTRINETLRRAVKQSVR